MTTKDVTGEETTPNISSSVTSVSSTTSMTTSGATQWIFGYGSLVWKVDFPYVRRFAGYVTGYKRRFWLSSVDHRGLPGAPGRVCTLVASEDPEEKVWGLAYEIPADDAIRRHLDHRERGGYSRRDVLFHLRSTEDVAADVPAEIPVVVYIAGDDVVEYLGPQPLPCIANVIADAVGSSGHNAEYLLNLADAMRTLAPEAEDDHLYGLEQLVRARLEERRSNAERNEVAAVGSTVPPSMTTPNQPRPPTGRRKRRSVSFTSASGDERRSHEGSVDRIDVPKSRVLDITLDDRQEE